MLCKLLHDYNPQFNQCTNSSKEISPSPSISKAAIAALSSSSVLFQPADLFISLYSSREIFPFPSKSYRLN